MTIHPMQLGDTSHVPLSIELKFVKMGVNSPVCCFAFAALYDLVRTLLLYDVLARPSPRVDLLQCNWGKV